MGANILAISISLAGIVGAGFSARVADRSGRKPLLISSAAILAAGLLPIAVLREYTQIWICVLVFGIGLGIYQANDWAIASDVLPTRDRAATEMGAWQSSETAVQILVGLIMGPVIDGLNAVRPGAGYVAMVLTASSLFLLSILLVPRIQSAR